MNSIRLFLPCLPGAKGHSHASNTLEENDMNSKALVVIDMQNDITKHYREIIDRLNTAIEWAAGSGMEIVYIQHNNLSAGTRTFKPGTKGAELVPELRIVSDHIFVKTKASALTPGKQRRKSLIKIVIVRQLSQFQNQPIFIRNRFLQILPAENEMPAFQKMQILDQVKHALAGPAEFGRILVPVRMDIAMT